MGLLKFQEEIEQIISSLSEDSELNRKQLNLKLDSCSYKITDLISIKIS